MPEGLTDDVKRGFARLVGELSPENLTCDGERLPGEVRRALARLSREWAALERRAGRKVTESEAWDFPWEP